MRQGGQSPTRLRRSRGEAHAPPQSASRQSDSSRGKATDRPSRSWPMALRSQRRERRQWAVATRAAPWAISTRAEGRSKRPRRRPDDSRRHDEAVYGTYARVASSARRSRSVAPRLSPRGVCSRAPAANLLDERARSRKRSQGATQPSKSCERADRGVRMPPSLRNGRRAQRQGCAGGDPTRRATAYNSGTGRCPPNLVGPRMHSVIPRHPEDGARTGQPRNERTPACERHVRANEVAVDAKAPSPSRPLAVADAATGTGRRVTSDTSQDARTAADIKPICVRPDDRHRHEKPVPGMTAASSTTVTPSPEIS